MDAETDRLRCEVVTAKGMARFWQAISEGKDAEVLSLRADNERLRARVAELEAAAAIQRGTLQMQTMQTTDGGTRFTWNVPPSAPPHND